MMHFLSLQLNHVSCEILCLDRLFAMMRLCFHQIWILFCPLHIFPMYHFLYVHFLLYLKIYNIFFPKNDRYSITSWFTLTLHRNKCRVQIPEKAINIPYATITEKSACPSIKPYKSNPEKNIVPTKNKIPSHPSSWML